jgi:hypothetical protein
VVMSIIQINLIKKRMNEKKGRFKIMIVLL